MRMPDASAPKHRVPLGLLMLARGYLTEQQLQEVLRAQVQAGHGKIGTWAQKLNFASERQVLNALSLQWSCPLLSLQTPPDPACRRMIPWPLLQSLRMLPVRFVRSTSLLYIAVCAGVDYGALSAIEQILNCHTVPCLVSDRAMDDWMEVELNRQSSRVQVFEKTSGAAEMARITASYAGRLSAEGIRIVRCGHYAWARLTGAGANSDLLFDLSPSYPMGAPRLPETLSAAV